MTPPRSVNQTFDSVVFEVPTASLPALVQCASRPGAPGARSSATCADGATHATQRRTKSSANLTGSWLLISFEPESVPLLTVDAVLQANSCGGRACRSRPLRRAPPP